MRTFGFALFVGGSLALGVTAGCSGGGGSSGSGANSGPMFIQTCSLGCSNGTGGASVSCGVAVASPNSEIAIIFSEPVKPSTVTSGTFQLVDVNSGQVPVGTRFVDPNNPRRVVFRPAVTFGPTGAPSFGFEAGTTYRITIPGEAQSPNGPFIQSIGNKNNRSRMQCDIQTTAPVVDLVPGSPTVSVTVDLAVTATPDPNDIVADQPANNAVDVWRDSTVTLTFNDIMNPATLVNQATQQPTFLSIRVDADGNLSTTDDQDVWPGNYVLTLDLDNLSTTVVYTPTLGLPSGGISHNRRMIVELSQSVQDLALNPLSNFGVITFVPETTTTGSATLPDSDGENFTDTSNFDDENSSAAWGGGRLSRGFGGGSGRLGKLLVRANQTVALDTGSQDFPLPGTPRDILDNAVHGVDYDPAASESTWPDLTITDGAFEFTSITVEQGGVLTLRGANPARLFSRGAANILGSIDVAGVSNGSHDSAEPDGQPSGTPGPGGGAGGAGGDRQDYTGNTGANGLLATTAGGGLPAGSSAITNPGSDTNGRGGLGVGGDVNGLGAGTGGLHFPTDYPTSRVTVAPSLGSGGFTNPVALGSNVCYMIHVATPGGGGGYALDGSPSVPVGVQNEPSAVNGSPNVPPIVPGDQNGDGGPGGANINIESPDPEAGHLVRRLAFETGALRGGSGGGGGGGSLFRTTTQIGADDCQGPTRPINAFFDHSGAAGGGGGGALQLVSGGLLTLSGTIDASGGDGGSAKVFPTTGIPDRTHHACPGGGGSGGAVRLQGVVVDIDASPTPGTVGRVDVSGGRGGVMEACWAEDDFVADCESRGGDGSPGLIRIEDTSGALTRLSEAAKLLPYDAGADLESRDWLSVGTWLQPRRRPESFSGAVSCWMTPPGSFFVLTFDEDDLTPPGTANDTYGWNMEVLYDDGSGLRAINYRGPDPDSPFDPNSDLETLLLNNLNYGLPAAQRSYFAVRFQGVRLRGDFAGNLCDVNLNTDSGIQHITPDSLTTWVRHPADLNDFSPRPTAVRFSVVFDSSLEIPGSVASFIVGVRNLRIETIPD